MQPNACINNVLWLDNKSNHVCQGTQNGDDARASGEWAGAMGSLGDYVWCASCIMKPVSAYLPVLALHADAVL